MAIKLDIEEGDIILTGKFKNKRTKVRSIGTDEDGHPTINGKSILKFKIEKLLPQEDKSKKTREQQQEATGMDRERFKKLAGIDTGEDNSEKTLKEFRSFGMATPGKLGTDQFSEQTGSQYMDDETEQPGDEPVRLERAEELLNDVLESVSAKRQETGSTDLLDEDLLDDIRQFLGAF